MTNFLPNYKILLKCNYYDSPKLPRSQFYWNRHGRFNDYIHIKPYGSGVVHVTYPFHKVDYFHLLGWSDWETGMLPSQTYSADKTLRCLMFEIITEDKHLRNWQHFWDFS